jgi:hypothetical protein
MKKIKLFEIVLNDDGVFKKTTLRVGINKEEPYKNMGGFEVCILFPYSFFLDALQETRHCAATVDLIVRKRGIRKFEASVHDSSDFYMMYDSYKCEVNRWYDTEFLPDLQAKREKAALEQAVVQVQEKPKKAKSL